MIPFLRITGTQIAHSQQGMAKQIKWGIGVTGLMLLFVTAFLLRFPPGPRPWCHRQIDGAFHQWMLETNPTNTYPSNYPNASGNAQASLAMIEPYFGPHIHDYGYVPGLREDDPKGLVFMYLKKKTRHTYHADLQHSIFSPRRWFVLPPAIIEGPCPEGGALLDTPEFKHRLQDTIAFLKEKQRPHWETIIAEQTAFLHSLRD